MFIPGSLATGEYVRPVGFDPQLALEISRGHRRLPRHPPGSGVIEPQTPAETRAEPPDGCPLSGAVESSPETHRKSLQGGALDERGGNAVT